MRLYSGALAVSGSGRVTMSGNLLVGSGGSGTLTLRDDAVVQAATVFLANDAGTPDINSAQLRNSGVLEIASDRARLLNNSGGAAVIRSDNFCNQDNVILFSHSGSLVFDNNIEGAVGRGTMDALVTTVPYETAPAPFTSTLNLIHNGSGVTRLTGNITNRADITVSAGTLLIDGAAMASHLIYSGGYTTNSGTQTPSLVRVQNGATLGGSGTIFANAAGAANGYTYDAIIVESGATLQPGGAGEIGTLTVGTGGEYFLLNGSAVVFDVASSASYDRLLGNGICAEPVWSDKYNLYLDGTATVADIVINFMSGFDYEAGKTYKLGLIEYVQGISNANLIWNNLDPNWEVVDGKFAGGFSGVLSFQLQQIPEPATWALWLTALVALAAVSQKKRNHQDTKAPRI